jgi:NTP pyrophosphatase (non-canonical NTP hydrolase)
MKTLNELRDKIHANAVEHGFYDCEDELGRTISEDERNAFLAQKIALIHSEVSEALEAHMRIRWAGATMLSKMEEWCEDDEFVDVYGFDIKGSIEEELANVIIRTIDLCGRLEIDTERISILQSPIHILLPMSFGLTLKSL